MLTTFSQNPLSSLFGGRTKHTSRIAVIGVGGAGGNALNTLVREGTDGIDVIAINTDAQVLSTSQADICLQVGRNETNGLGAGADPEVGAKALEADRNSIQALVEPYDMIIVTAGMGGGTGTGGAPIVASIAQDLDILSVGVVTRPFSCEGQPRMRAAEEGIQQLQKHTDTLLVIPNDRLFELTDEQTSLREAFRFADKVLCDATRGIVEIITHEGLVNLDFADVERTMEGGGMGMLGVSTSFSMRQSQPTNIGGVSNSSEGEQHDTGRANRPKQAAMEAISSPLFDGYSIQGAENVLVNVTGGNNLRFQDVMAAVEVIQGEVDTKSEILFGAVVDEEVNDHFQVTVIATGVDGPEPHDLGEISSDAETQFSRMSSEELEESTADQGAEKRNGTG